MKTYKFLTIHPNTQNLDTQWTSGENLINEYVDDGWSVEHVTSGKDGDIVVTISKEQTDTQMLFD